MNSPTTRALFPKRIIARSNIIRRASLNIVAFQFSDIRSGSRSIRLYKNRSFARGIDPSRITVHPRFEHPRVSTLIPLRALSVGD